MHLLGGLLLIKLLENSMTQINDFLKAADNFVSSINPHLVKVKVTRYNHNPILANNLIKATKPLTPLVAFIYLLCRNLVLCWNLVRSCMLVNLRTSGVAFFNTSVRVSNLENIQYVFLILVWLPCITGQIYTKERY